jgi:hypothetical protein
LLLLLSRNCSREILLGVRAKNELQGVLQVLK